MNNVFPRKKRVHHNLADTFFDILKWSFLFLSVQKYGFDLNRICIFPEKNATIIKKSMGGTRYEHKTGS